MANRDSSPQISYVPLAQLQGAIEYAGDYLLGRNEGFIVLSDERGQMARVSPSILLAHSILERISNRARCEAVIWLTCKILGQEPQIYDDFSDHRVILATFDDDSLAQVSDAPFRHEQSAYGPTYLVIRPNATEESLTNAAARFGVPMCDLTEFRAHQAR